LNYKIQIIFGERQSLVEGGGEVQSVDLM